MKKFLTGFMVFVFYPVSLLWAFVRDEIVAWPPMSIAFYVLSLCLVIGAMAYLKSRKIVILGLIYILLLACFYAFPSSRRHFLHDLAKVKLGMSEEEVQSIMHGYLEGTGWPANPFQDQSAAGTLTEAGTGKAFRTGTNTAGELVLSDSIVFRHDPSEADWGVVELKSNRVVSVSFLPD